MEDRVGEKLRKLRRDFEYSESYIARQIGIPVEEYCLVEDSIKELTLSQLKKLTAFYGLPYESLIVDEYEVSGRDAVIQRMIQPSDINAGDLPEPSEAIPVEESDYLGRFDLLQDLEEEPAEDDDDIIDVDANESIEEVFESEDELYEASEDILEDEDYEEYEYDEEDEEEPVIEIVPPPFKRPEPLEPVETVEPVKEVNHTEAPKPAESMRPVELERMARQRRAAETVTVKTEKEAEKEVKEEVKEEPKQANIPKSASNSKPEVPKKKRNKFFIWLLITVLAIDAAVFGLFMYKPYMLLQYVDKGKQLLGNATEMMAGLTGGKEGYDKAHYKKLWQSNKEINEDYVGQLYFESGLVDVPVVKGTANSVYENINWETGEEDATGSVYLDCLSNLSDQNLVIRGNYIADTDQSLTPLEALLSQENYEENCNLSFVLENEIRRYRVSAVYYCELYEEAGFKFCDSNMEYYWSNYDDTYFETYIGAVKQAKLYDTGVDLKYNDRFLTLEVESKEASNKYEIVICKEVGYDKISE